MASSVLEPDAEMAGVGEGEDVSQVASPVDAGFAAIDAVLAQLEAAIEGL